MTIYFAFDNVKVMYNSLSWGQRVQTILENLF